MRPAEAMDRAQGESGTDAGSTERRKQLRRAPAHPFDGSSRLQDGDRRLCLGRRWEDWRRA
jgi:hypothetical protein